MENIESLVLLDAPSGTGGFERSTLEGMGHKVLVCHGPTHEAGCPVLHQDGNCEMVDAAHGVVFELDLDRPEHRRILARYQEIIREDIPIRVVLKEGQGEKYAELLGGVEVWSDEPSASELDAFSSRVEAMERTTEELPGE